MSEEEKNILVTKRKYWTKFMKYNLVGTIFLVIYFFVFRMLFHSDIGLFPEAPRIISESLWVVGSICMISLFIAWPLSFIIYGYQSFKIYKINRKELSEQHEASKDLTSVSSTFAKMGQETRKEIGDVLDKKEDIDENINENKVTNPKEITEFQESKAVFSAGIFLMAIYAISILFIDNPYAACIDSNIEEMADCMNRANLFFKGLSFVGAIGLILSLIGIYTKPPRLM